MKFEDLNGDGIKNGSDAGLQNWTIELDKDANGTVDATTVTDGSGNYSFTGLLAAISACAKWVKTDWVQTSVNPGDVTVVSGTESTGNDFGNFKKVKITGTKFTDKTGDGLSGDDTVLNGVTIIFTRAPRPPEPSSPVR